MASVFLRATGGFLLGAVAVGAATFFLGIAAPEVFNISQFEGAYMMAVAFVYTPTGALFGGIAGAIVMALRKPAKPKDQ